MGVAQWVPIYDSRLTQVQFLNASLSPPTSHPASWFPPSSWGQEFFWDWRGTPVRPTFNSILYRGVLNVLVTPLGSLVLGGWILAFASRHARSRWLFWTAIGASLITFVLFVRACT